MKLVNCILIAIVLLTLHVSKGVSFLNMKLFEGFLDPQNVELPPMDEENQVNVHEDVLIPVIYEELSPEDKFLQEAEKLNTIINSNLGTCEHKVVMKIQSSCSKLSEEELAKLSIKLLNCQNEVSGRSQVTCSDDMSLKECTSPMDSETWNAYHIINNRARAVCYATRQQQFQALSEMTVNKLMSSARKHLMNMDDLEDLQKELNLLTTEALRSLKDDQQLLEKQSSGLQQAQQRVRDNIAANLRQLTSEKTLIQSTHSQLNSLSQQLDQQLSDIMAQVDTQNQQHLKMLSSITDIVAKTEEIYSGFDDINRLIKEQRDEMNQIHAETIVNLKQINTSVSYLLSLVSHVRTHVDETITWISGLIGDRQFAISVSQHVLLLLVGVLLSLFLGLSLSCRLLLLAAVIANIALTNQQKALDLFSLAVTICGMWASVVVIPVCWPAFKQFKLPTRLKPQTVAEKEADEPDDDIASRSSTKSENSSSYRFHSNGLPPHFSTGTESGSLSSFRHRQSTPTETRTHIACAALCRNGQLCRSSPTPGQKYCKRHITH